MITWSEIARMRQGLYRFLGEALLSPTPERFATLVAARHYLSGLELDRFGFSREWERMASHLNELPDLGRLESEHVRLFASGMSRSLSPAIESFYRAPHKGGALAEFVAALQREYHRLGIVTPGGEESPDHLSTECSVMSFLCRQEVEAREEEDDRRLSEILEQESGFLRNHLAVWVPLFRDRVVAGRPHAFYRDLVDAVHAFVIHDDDLVRTLEIGVAL